MEAQIFFLIVGAIVVALIIYAVRRSNKASEWNTVFDQVAKRFGATLFPGRGSRPPALIFGYQDTNVHIKCARQGGHKLTQAMIQFPDQRLACEIFAVGEKAVPPNEEHLMPISTYANGFDSRLNVRARDPNTAKNLLTPTVQHMLLELLARKPEGGLFVGFRGGYLYIRKRVFLNTADDLETFVHLAIALYDQALLANAEGIDFVQGEAPEEAHCPVCGESLHLDRVLCRRCQTPHHQECWSYNGSCAVYACGCTQSFIPGMPTPNVLPRKG